MKKISAAELLRSEAARFETLAKDHALKVLTAPDDVKANHTRIAREHLLRAEVYKDAAALTERGCPSRSTFE